MVAQAPILVVDDDADIREALSDFLGLEGYDVVVAANGKEALDVVQTTPVSVILLDLMMPVMDGYAFLDEQHRRADIADIPVVVISAGSDIRVAELHSAEVLRKPLDLASLFAALRRCSPS